VSDSLRKAVAILDALRLSPNGNSARTLAGETGIPRSTVQRLLQTLEETKLVAQDSQQLKYRLGPRTLVLGMAYKQGLDLGTVALPIMRKLRDETHETIGLSVAVGHERMFIEEVQSFRELRFASELGRMYPLWSGAPGRVLMLDLEDLEVDAALGDPTTASDTVYARPSREAFLERLADARQDGHAKASDETIDGIASVAVPVRDAGAHVVAALSLSGPSDRVTPLNEEGIVAALTTAATELSRSLGNAPGRVHR